MKTQAQIELDAEIMDVLVDTTNELVSESGLEGEVCQGYQEALVVFQEWQKAALKFL